MMKKEIKKRPKDKIEKTKDTDKHREYRFYNHRRKRTNEKIDLEILVALNTYRLLTTTKIAELTRLNSPSAKLHLQKLEKRGLVQRFKKGTFESWSYWFLPDSKKEAEIE